jgi:hypothetical protein
MSDSNAPNNARDTDEGVHPYPGTDRPADAGAESMTGGGEDTPVASPSVMEGHADNARADDLGQPVDE